MKYLDIFIAILLISLIFHIVIFITAKNKVNPIVEIERTTCFYVTIHEWRILPTIQITICGRYLEINIEWIRFAFYAAYRFVHEDDNS